MKILGLDTSGLVATAAIVEDGILIVEYTVHYKKTHSQTLLPMLDEIKRMIELDLNTIDAIAIASGPGSFTGLRIGAATAKGLGFALQKPLVEVPTLEGLAYNLCGVKSLVCPLMDARRNQVYTGIYKFTPQQLSWRMETLQEQCVVDVGIILEKLNQFGQEVIFLGDGAPVYAEQIAQKLAVSYQFAPANNNRQRAASVAALGAEYFAQGRIVSAQDHQPEYLRMSQAEREAAERKAAKHETAEHKAAELEAAKHEAVNPN